MRPAIVIFSTVSAIEVALVCHVKAALQRLAVMETLSRFQDVVAGEFATDFIEKLHSLVKEPNSLRQLACEAILPGSISLALVTFFLDPRTGQPGARRTASE